MRNPFLFLEDPGYLSEDQDFRFPKPEKSSGRYPSAVGGNLSPGMLLSAYKQGFFPWYGEGDPILWWNPEPRFLLFPEEFLVSKSLKRFLKKTNFTVTLDTAFKEVITSCSVAPRPYQDGTWITEEMIKAYSQLHSLGFAHSAETWSEGRLTGGLYGVSLGNAFFGESMFFEEPNASKTAFVFLVDLLKRKDFSFIDCQVYTPYLEGFGAREVKRSDFLVLLKKALEKPILKGSWQKLSTGPD